LAPEAARVLEPQEAEPAIVIVGAGPAGLTAGWELARLGYTATIYERDRIVGGISQTVNHQGYRFDLGGHRFFTKASEVQQIWEEILADDFVERQRLSRIYYRGHFFDYPLKPLNALIGLGPVEALRVLASFARSRLRPERPELNFEQWVSNRFGRRLFEIFFKTYTEKVWGMKCSEISADWAAQRIQNLDLGRAVLAALFGGATAGSVKSLIHRFHYPRLGPGMMWERCAEALAGRGTPTRLESELVRISHRDGRVRSISTRNSSGLEEEREVEHLLCSIPLGRTALLLDPPAPEEVRQAARGLRHRDFLTVMLVVDAAELFPDNWIYVHEPDVRVGRIQNFKNWSPDMVPDASKTALGLEYFVNRGDELWSLDDGELVALATRELARLGLDAGRPVVDGAVVRVPNAYPVYDDGYRDRIATVRGHLEGLENLTMIGRNGQHRYNNQDHSMLTGIFAARTIAGQPQPVWDVNADDAYHEEARASADRLVPQVAPDATLEEMFAAYFARFDAWALGAAVGGFSGLTLFLVTASMLVFYGGEPEGTASLSLLSIYIVGYEISWPGALLGLVGGCILGFLLGFAIATCINLLMTWTERSLLDALEEEHEVEPVQGLR